MQLLEEWLNGCSENKERENEDQKRKPNIKKLLAKQGTHLLEPGSVFEHSFSGSEKPRRSFKTEI